MIHDDIKKKWLLNKLMKNRFYNLEVQIFSPISLFRFEKKADVDTFLIFFSSPWYNTNLVAKHTSRSYDTGKAKNAVVQRRSGGDFRPNKTSWFTSWQHGLLFVRLPLVCLSWRIRRMTIGIAVVMTQPLSLLVEEGWNQKWLNEPA
jgi:hypothetical protein